MEAQQDQETIKCVKDDSQNDASAESNKNAGDLLAARVGERLRELRRSSLRACNFNEREWSTVKFGKYAGHGWTLPQVIFHDLDWFLWSFEKKAFANLQAIEAEVLYKRVQCVRIPPKNGELQVAEYIGNPEEFVFERVDIVPKSTPPYGFARTDWIDLTVARAICEYDKRGNQQLIQTVKSLYFPSDPYMTELRCEQFFNTSLCFDLQELARLDQ